MAVYEYGRIRKLADRLLRAGVAPDVIDRIMAGGEEILKSTSSEKKADWMKGAMDRMDQLLDPETRHAVREACACCLGGKRLRISKAIARDYETLDERIRAASEAKFVFGHSVERQEDGRVLVRFAPEGQEEYGCVCLPGAATALSITYCYCCCGHVKHHLQTALGCKLKGAVRSSALSSGGTKPCTFLFEIVAGTGEADCVKAGG